MEKSVNINDVGVSVIIPTYRQKDTFLLALESVLAQTHKILEIIVIDDNTQQEFSEWIITNISLIDSDIVYVKNPINLGAAQSRNKGVELSNYDYVTFLDDDDFYENNKIEFQLKEMLE